MSPVKEANKKDDYSVLMTELVLPQHTNALGAIFGGVVMSWIDIAGAIAAMRFAKRPVVTVSIDSLHFIVPIKTGNTVLTRARVTWSGTTSIEVEVLVEAENSITGVVNEATHAYLTYVAIDDNGDPTPVPKFTPKTPGEKERFEEAKKRRKSRLSNK
ncbi:acyl-CoA thioesterase [bacterium]|nr:acyl-CoA thioesterase [bacterium]